MAIAAIPAQISIVSVFRLVAARALDWRLSVRGFTFVAAGAAFEGVGAGLTPAILVGAGRAGVLVVESFGSDAGARWMAEQAPRLAGRAGKITLPRGISLRSLGDEILNDGEGGGSARFGGDQSRSRSDGNAERPIAVRGVDGIESFQDADTIPVGGVARGLAGARVVDVRIGEVSDSGMPDPGVGRKILLYM